MCFFAEILALGKTNKWIHLLETVRGSCCWCNLSMLEVGSVPRPVLQIYLWLFDLVWPWPLNSWPPKLMASSACPVDHLCQLASKSVHLFSKYCIDKFGNKRTGECIADPSFASAGPLAPAGLRAPHLIPPFPLLFPLLPSLPLPSFLSRYLPPFTFPCPPST